MTGVYLLHIEPGYKHAHHYLGFAEDIEPRINAHLHGHGARLTQVAVDAGCSLVLVRVWPGATRRDERRLKNQKHAPALCPICAGRVGVQLPLLPGVHAYIPEGEVSQ